LDNIGCCTLVVAEVAVGSTAIVARAVSADAAVEGKNFEVDVDSARNVVACIALFPVQSVAVLVVDMIAVAAVAGVEEVVEFVEFVEVVEVVEVVEAAGFLQHRMQLPPILFPSNPRLASVPLFSVPPLSAALEWH